MKQLYRGVVVILVAVVAAGVTGLPATAATGVPYPTNAPSQGFETGTFDALDHWSDNDQGTVRFTNSPVLVGSQSLFVNGDAAILSVDGSGDYTNVWVKMYVRSAGYDDVDGDPADTNDVTAAFFISTNGNLKVFGKTNGSSTVAWHTIQTGLNVDQWYGVSVRMDYGQELWDLYLDSSPGGTEDDPVKVNHLPISFSGIGGASQELYQVVVSAGGTAYVDNVALGLAHDALDENTESPGTVNIVEAEATVGDAMDSGTLIDYFDGDGVSLGGEFGDALRSGLPVGTVLYFYNPGPPAATYGYEVKSDGAGGTYWDPVGGAPDASTISIFRTTGFWLDIPEGESGGGSVAVTVFGTIASTSPSNVTLVAGWNSLRWPYATRSINNTSPGLGFSSVSGDLMYVWDSSLGTTGGWAGPYFYDADRSAGQRWRDRRYSASASLLRGKGFWYYNDGTAKAWNIGDVE